jgi:transcription elongation factor GreA
MKNDNILITKIGFETLKAELLDLVNQKRPALVERLATARSMGDLSENSDYQSAKEDLSFMDGKIEELEEIIKNCTPHTPTTKDNVDFGHAVTVKVNGTQVTFQIVGEWEANPTLKKISNSSPLGKALMGKKIGEQVEVVAPAGKVVYTVVGIE